MAKDADNPGIEQVMAVPRAAFFEGRWPQGFLPMAANDANALLARLAAAASFLDRPTAEGSPAWKQLIPYCVLRRPGAVLCVQRRKAQTESRLHGMLSIGLGGHINPDRDPPHGARVFLAALWRELDEELVLPRDQEPRLIGLLNDDSSPVGQVHAGLVYVLDLPAHPPGRPENVRVREISKMSGGFRSLVELQTLWQDPGRFESWSRLLLDAGVAGTLDSRVQGTQPANGREERNHG